MSAITTDITMQNLGGRNRYITDRRSDSFSVVSRLSEC